VTVVGPEGRWVREEQEKVLELLRAAQQAAPGPANVFQALQLVDNLDAEAGFHLPAWFKGGQSMTISSSRSSAHSGQVPSAERVPGGGGPASSASGDGGQGPPAGRPESLDLTAQLTAGVGAAAYVEVERLLRQAEEGNKALLVRLDEARSAAAEGTVDWAEIARTQRPVAKRIDAALAGVDLARKSGDLLLGDSAKLYFSQKSYSEGVELLCTQVRHGVEAQASTLVVTNERQAEEQRRGAARTAGHGSSGPPSEGLPVPRAIWGRPVAEHQMGPAGKEIAAGQARVWRDLDRAAETMAALNREVKSITGLAERATRLQQEQFESRDRLVRLPQEERDRLAGERDARQARVGDIRTEITDRCKELPYRAVLDGLLAASATNRKLLEQVARVLEPTDGTGVAATGSVRKALVEVAEAQEWVEAMIRKSLGEVDFAQKVANTLTGLSGDFSSGLQQVPQNVGRARELVDITADGQARVQVLPPPPPPPPPPGHRSTAVVAAARPAGQAPPAAPTTGPVALAIRPSSPAGPPSPARSR
jgi:hypothetical protein